MAAAVFSCTSSDDGSGGVVGGVVVMYGLPVCSSDTSMTSAPFPRCDTMTAFPCSFVNTLAFVHSVISLVFAPPPPPPPPFFLFLLLVLLFFFSAAVSTPRFLFATDVDTTAAIAAAAISMLLGMILGVVLGVVLGVEVSPKYWPAKLLRLPPL